MFFVPICIDLCVFCLFVASLRQLRFVYCTLSIVSESYSDDPSSYCRLMPPSVFFVHCVRMLFRRSFFFSRRIVSAALFLLLACFLCLFPLDGCLPLCGEGSLCELREVYLQAGRQGGHSWRPNATAAQRGFIGFFLIKIAKNIIFSLSKICIYQKFFVPLHPICKKYRLPTNYQSYPHSLSAVRASRCHPRPYIF